MSTKALEELLADSASRIAIFRAAAFHVHSPDSYDWASRSGADKQRNDSTKLVGPAGMKSFADELKKNFDIVAITDHMKSNYATKLASGTDRGSLLVIPGMEVSCKMPPCPGLIHLLVLLPPGTGTAGFDRLFSEITFPEETKRNGKEQFSLENWDSFRSSVEKANGLLIFAHIGSDAGHRQVLREALKGALKSFELPAGGSSGVEKKVAELYAAQLAKLNPDAVEILKAEEKVHYLSFEYDSGTKQAGFPCVMRSDFHCLEEFDQPSCITYVKVPDLSYDSVRKAFKFPATRIRFHSDRPPLPSPRFLGISIEAGESNERIRSLNAAFSGNLNCLIGPRGSGKTTFIEAIRLATGNNLDFDTWTESAPKEVAKAIQSGNLQNAIVKLLFQGEDGRKFRIEASFSGNGKDVSYEVFDESDKIIAMTSQALKERFQCRIFSWSQLESLGRNKSDQLDLLDQFKSETKQAKVRYKSAKNDLSVKQNSLHTLAQQLEQLTSDSGSQLTRYTEFKTDFEALNTPEVAELFGKVDDCNEKLNMLNVELSRHSELITTLADLDVQPDLKFVLPTDKEDLSSLEAWVAEISGSLSSVAAEVNGFNAAKSTLAAALKKRSEEIQQLLTASESELSKSYEEIRSKLNLSADQAITNLQRTKAKEDLDSVKTKRDEYLKLWSKFEDELNAREECLEQCKQSAEELRTLRIQCASDVQSELKVIVNQELEIGVQLLDHKDRTQLIDALKGGVLSRENAGQFNQTKFAERLASMGDSQCLSKYLLQEDKSDYSSFTIEPDSADSVLKGEELIKLHDSLACIKRDEGLDALVVDSTRLKRVLDIGLKDDIDILSITLGGKSIENISPGQRCSVLLPLVAMSENCPLVIDQPEDNLDNRLIGNVIIQVLASLKEKRQIIVSTHNANLVVGGDAEQVIVFDTEDGYCTKTADGSIDSEPVVNAVLGIMEGGKEAFDARRVRYGF